MNFILRYVSLVIALSCFGNGYALAADVRPECPPLSDNYYFFPPPSGPAVSPTVYLDEFRCEWYSKHLRAMSEPSLSCGPNSYDEIYRFTWLRSFHHPIAVRVVRADDGIQLTAVKLSGTGGDEPGDVLQKIHRSLSFKQWETLISAIAAFDFWAKPSGDPSSGYTDGAQWIVEARQGKAYHVVDRWAGDGGGSYRSLGLLFLELAGLTPTEKSDRIY